MQWERREMVVSDDLSRIDLDTVCRLLESSYWAATRPRAAIERSLQSSIVFGNENDKREKGRKVFRSSLALALALTRTAPARIIEEMVRGGAFGPRASGLGPRRRLCGTAEFYLDQASPAFAGCLATL